MRTVRNPQPTTTQRDQRAVVYCRISKDPTGREMGVRRQEQDCRDLCEQLGYEIASVFVDDDLSAFSGKRRPGYEAMKALIASGGASVLVAWHPDRITRRPRELEDIIDLLDATHAVVRTVQAGEYDLSTASGKMTARIVGNVATGESDHKSDRLKRKHLELAEAGKLAGGGTRPFGYERDRIKIRESEATVIRDMAVRVLAGESLRSIVAVLNAAGSVTSAGLRWTPTAVRRVLTSPRVAGLRSHKGQITAVARWDPIIDADDHRHLTAILTDPTRTTNSGGRERKLLTGLIHCGACKAKMISRPRNGRAAYLCPKDMGGCGGTAILGDPVDDAVVEAVLYRLTSPEMTAALTPPADDEAILGELRKLEGRRGELAELWAAGDVSRTEWSAASTALDKRQAALEADLRYVAVAAARPDAAGMAERWPNLSNDQRRTVLADYIARIDIGAAVRGRNRFDDGRVNVTWNG